MKKNFVVKLSTIMIFTFFSLLCFSGSAASPGTQDDPLVSVSYVNEVIMPQIKSYVDSQQSGNSFQVIEVKKGQKIIGIQGTEYILRMGSAKIIATQKGGIADATLGVDLPQNTPMPANHLLIVPFNDGRGVLMETDGILLIKGTYTIS